MCFFKRKKKKQECKHEKVRIVSVYNYMTGEEPESVQCKDCGEIIAVGEEKIKKYFPDYCVHDWEVLETSKGYYKLSNGRYYKINISGLDSYCIGLIESFPQKKICLKCGECIDEIKQAKKQIMEEKREVRRRKSLAKQMWQDLNCDGKV